MPYYELLTDTLALGDEITLVGYGGTGATTKRRGTNLVEALIPPDPSAAADVFAYDFDGDTPTQATVVGGDSGSGTFVHAGGVWKLAGINTFSWENPAIPGTGTVRGGGGMIVAAHAPWIQSVTVVPEPAMWAMLLPGVLLVCWLARYRRSREGGD